MERKLTPSIRDKRLIVFDVDGTLTPSKSTMDIAMRKLFVTLLQHKMVAAIGGGKYDLFREQFLKQMPRRSAYLKRLFLFPTSSTSFYRWERGGWRNVYSRHLSLRERKKIIAAFQKAFREVGYIHPARTYGKVLEDRITQITFSALGQDVARALGKRGIRLKEEWGRTAWRKKIARSLKKLLPEFEVRRGGLTSIDVTRKGIDKGYGIRQIEKTLKISRRDMLFVGDAIFPGGNDYAVVRAGVDYMKVKGPEDTKKIIRYLVHR